MARSCLQMGRTHFSYHRTCNGGYHSYQTVGCLTEAQSVVVGRHSVGIGPTL